MGQSHSPTGSCSTASNGSVRACSVTAGGPATGSPVQIPNWVEFIEIIAALSRLGVITVPIMPIYRHEEVGYTLTNAGIRAVFTASTFKKFSYLGMYHELRGDDHDLSIVVVRPDAVAEEAIGSGENIFALADLEADGEDASVRAELPIHPQRTIPSSSSTPPEHIGPKGCVHTFNTYCSGARSLARRRSPTPRDNMSVRPIPDRPHHRTGDQRVCPSWREASTHLMAEWDPVRAASKEIAATWLHGR